MRLNFMERMIKFLINIWRLKQYDTNDATKFKRDAEERYPVFKREKRARKRLKDSTTKLAENDCNAGG